MEGILWIFNAIFHNQLHNAFKTLGFLIYSWLQGMHGSRFGISSCYLPANTDTCYPAGIYKGHPSCSVLLIPYVDFWIFSLFASFTVSDESVICLSHVLSVKLMVKISFYQKNCCLGLFCFILCCSGFEHFLVLAVTWVSGSAGGLPFSLSSFSGRSSLKTQPKCCSCNDAALGTLLISRHFHQSNCLLL